jgi:hypothetical protein
MFRDRRSSDETFERPEYENLSRHNRSAFSQAPAVVVTPSVLPGKAGRFAGEVLPDDDGYGDDDR